LGLMGWSSERLVFYCRTASASTAPGTSRKMSCPTHCASYWAPFQPLLRAFSGWVRSPRGGVQGFGLVVQGLGIRDQGSGIRESGSRVLSAGFRGSETRVQGSSWLAPASSSGARPRATRPPPALPAPEREFFSGNLLVRIHFIIVMIRWTGLAPWEFEFPFPGSLTSTFLESGTAPPAVWRGAKLPLVFVFVY